MELYTNFGKYISNLLHSVMQIESFYKKRIVCEPIKLSQNFKYCNLSKYLNLDFIYNKKAHGSTYPRTI